MTPAELAKECGAAIERAAKLDIKPFLRLTIPRECRGALRMVVFPKPRLMGEVLCGATGEDGSPYTVVLVNPFDVLAWLASQGLVKVVARNPDDVSQEVRAEVEHPRPSVTGDGDGTATG